MKLWKVTGSYMRPFIAGREDNSRATMTGFFVADELERAVEMWKDIPPQEAGSLSIHEVILLSPVGTIVLVDEKHLKKTTAHEDFKNVQNLWEAASDVLPRISDPHMKNRLAEALIAFSVPGIQNIPVRLDEKSIDE